VERTFGWLNRSRRLAKDYEQLPERSEAMIQIAMIRLMLARLAPKHQAQQQQKQHFLALQSHADLAA
jgi:Transposase DDE domain